MKLPDVAPAPEIRTKKLEFRFSISPYPSFYSTVRLAAMSLRRLGAPYNPLASWFRSETMRVSTNPRGKRVE